MSLPPDNFWDDEEEELFLILIGLYLLSEYYGIQGAAALTPDGDITNLDILTADVIAQYRAQAEGMTLYSRERIAAAWEQAGGDVAKFEELTQGIYSQNRARLMGITQITSAFAIIGLAVNQAAGRKSVWRTSNDARVCEECAAMEGETVDGGTEPPLHPGCRCWIEPE